MKKAITLIHVISLISFQFIYAQGFIVDGSFENNRPGRDCSAGLHTLSNTWKGYGTCELFQIGECPASPIFPTDITSNNDTIWSVDYWGYQTPRTGDYLTAIRLFDDEVDEWHEFMYTGLAKPFIEGRLYRISFYASVAESEEYISNSIGVGFSSKKVPWQLDLLKNPFDPFNPKPDFFYNLNHVMYESPTIFQEYEDWVRLDFYYTAKGDEKYLVIGNFNNDAQTEKIKVRENCPACRPSARLFIDDVSITSCSISEFELEKDSVVICENENYALDLTQYPYDILWDDSTHDKWKTFRVEGTHTVTYSDGKCSLKDSFYLYKVQPLEEIEDKLICSFADLPISIDIDYPYHPNNSFFLNDTKVTEIEIQEEDSYVFKVENEDCIQTEAFFVITEEENMNIFPNPFHEILTFTNDIEFVRVFNLLGQDLGRFEVIDHQLNLSNLTDGMYLLVFEGKCVTERKVMKINR